MDKDYWILRFLKIVNLCSRLTRIDIILFEYYEKRLMCIYIWFDIIEMQSLVLRWYDGS